MQNLAEAISNYIIYLACGGELTRALLAAECVSRRCHFELTILTLLVLCSVAPNVQPATRQYLTAAVMSVDSVKTIEDLCTRLGNAIAKLIVQRL